jgi:transcriptional regulator with XRE-family HTH domain
VSKKSRPEAYSAIQKEIGNRILWARELVFPNRSEFARLLEIDGSTLAKIETGDRPPSIFNVIAIAHRLRVSTEYILRGSLLGVDSELASLLLAHHQELRDAPRTGLDRGKAPAAGRRKPPN